MDPKIYIRMREIEDEHWWFVGRRNIIRRVLSSIDLPEGAHILDVGCGTGGNIRLLSEFGNVTCIESDGRAIEMAHARGIGNIYKGGLPDNIPVLNRTFDLIILVDVLEHIEDDIESLRRLQSLLSPKGY